MKPQNPLAGLIKPNPLAGLNTTNTPNPNPLGALGIGSPATSTPKPNPLAALGLGGQQSSGPSNPLAALGGSSAGGSPKVNLLQNMIQ